MENTEIVPTTEEIIVKELPTEKQALSKYLRFDIVQDFEQFPFIAKLALVQKTPKDKIKSREIGGKMVKYLPHKYCKKVLNFIFNFKISNKAISSEYKEYLTKAGKEVVEAELTVEFTFIHPKDNTPIVRTVCATHKMFLNPALSRGQAKQAAMSKSWTLVAETFGIGQDLVEEEDTDYDTLMKNSREPIETPAQPKKFYDIEY